MQIFAALGKKNKTLLSSFGSVSQLTTVFYAKNIFYLSLCGFVSLLPLNSCFREQQRCITNGEPFMEKQTPHRFFQYSVI